MPQRPSRRLPGRSLAIALGVIAIIGVAIWALVIRPAPVATPEPTPTASATPEPLPTPSATATASTPEQLNAAKKAVWNGSPSLTTDDGTHYEFGSDALVQAPFGSVLVSEGQAPDGAHAAAGRLAIFYLKSADASYAVAKRYPAAVEIGSFGRMGSWTVSDRFADMPVVEAKGGFTGQGYTCGQTILTALTPNGPVQIAKIESVYNDTGAKGDAGQSFEGRITNVEKARGFTVHYTGSKTFDRQYRYRDGTFVATGGSPLPQC